MLSRIINFYQQSTNTPAQPLPEHPLFDAAESGNLPAISAMMNYFPDLEMKDSAGNTPLIMAASTGMLAAMRILLNHGASLDTKGNGDFTALNVAAIMGQAEAAALLISRGAKLETLTESGHTPLWNAVENDHENVVRLLTAVGADVNSRDRSGHTVLMYAVLRGNRNIVGMLLQAGAKPNLVAGNGDTAEAVAAANGRFDIIELLRMDRFALGNLNFNLEMILDAPPAPVTAPVVETVEEAAPPVEPQQDEPPVVEIEQSDIDEEVYLERYICPISQEVMQDPVTLPSGKTFDRAPLCKYVESLNNPETFPCPLTRKPIPITALTFDTNTSIKQEIEERSKLIAEKKREREARAAEQQAQRSAQEELRNKRVQYFQQQGLFAGKKSPHEVPLPPSPQMRH